MFERAVQVLDSRSPEVVNYGIADELAFQVGLSCGGSIDVLIEPFVFDDEWNALRRCVEGQESVVYAIGLDPAPLLGRKLTRVIEGRSVGSIAPSLDSRITEEGAKLLQTGGTKVVDLPWQGEQAQVFLEVFRPSPSLLIVGATHTAISLCRLATEVGFSGYRHRRSQRAGDTGTFPRRRTANPCLAGGGAGAGVVG